MTIDLEDLLDAQPPAPQAVRKASIFDALETILDACGKDIPDKVLEQPGTSVLDQSQSDEGWAKFERGSNQSDDTDPYPGSRRPPADSLAYNLHQLRAIGEFAREKRVDAGVAYCDEGEKGEYIKPYADRVAVDDLDPAHSIGAAIFTLAKDHSFMTRIIGQYRVHRNGQEFSGEWTAGKRDPGDTAQQTFFNEIEEEGGVPPEAITMHVIPPFPTLKDGWSNALQEQYTICVDPEKLIGKRLSSNEIVQQQRILGDILLSGLYKTLKTLSLDPDPKFNDPLTEPSLLVSDPKYHKALALDAPLVQYALGSQLYHHIHGGAPWAKDDEHCDMDTLLAGITPGSVQATSEIDLKRVFAGLLEAVSHQDTDQTEQLRAAAKTLQDYLKNGENTTMKFMDTVISTHDGKPTTKKIMNFMRNVPVWPGDEDREVSLAEQSSREHSASVFILAERLGPDGAVMQGPDRESLYDVLALKRRRPPTSFEGKVLENIAVLTHGRGDLSHAVIDALNKELGYSFQMSDLKVVDAFADTDPTITDKHVRVIASLRGSVDPGLTNCAEGISVVILPKDCGSPQSEPNHPDDIGICRIPLEDAHKLLTSLQSKYPESYALDGELVGITAGYETAKVEARLMAEKAAADRETDTSAA